MRIKISPLTDQIITVVLEVISILIFISGIIYHSCKIGFQYFDALSSIYNELKITGNLSGINELYIVQIAICFLLLIALVVVIPILVSDIKYIKILFVNNKEKDEFIKTDFKNLYLKKGELVVIAAGASIGKTAFVLDLIKQLSFRREIPLQLIPCGHTTFEVLSSRLLCSYANIPVSKLLYHSDEFSLAEIKNIQKDASNLYGKPLYFEESFYAPTMSDVIYSIISCNENHKSEVVVIEDFLWIDDKLSLVRNLFNGKDSGIHKYRTKMELLKNLAEDLGIPIIIIVNLPESYEKTEPDLTAFTGELQIISVMADKVLLLHREKDNSAILNIAKDKNGPCSKLSMKFDSECLSFKQI